MISTPPALRLAALALWLCLPLAALETAVVSHAPIPRVSPDKLAQSCVPAFILCALLTLPVLKAWRPAWQAVAALGSVWFLATAWMAFREHDAWVGFLAIGLALYFAIYLPWLWRELRRAFCDPCIKWYHGLPKPIPGLVCEIASGRGGPADAFHVSALDRRGIFLFRPASTGAGATSAAWPGRRSHDKVRELSLTFRDRRVACQGIATRALLRSGQLCGIGFRFSGMSPDMRKQLGDFIEVLKGEGYVQ